MISAESTSRIRNFIQAELERAGDATVVLDEICLRDMIKYNEFTMELVFSKISYTNTDLGETDD